MHDDQSARLLQASGRRRLASVCVQPQPTTYANRSPTFASNELLLTPGTDADHRHHQQPSQIEHILNAMTPPPAIRQKASRPQSAYRGLEHGRRDRARSGLLSACDRAAGRSECHLRHRERDLAAPGLLAACLPPASP